ncbi:DUF3105 domain-containing protein [Cellulomonas sp. JZ18]|uniref:DUF3105 domain-containing protein n=1 Tax=Cellulomonas sp. JZ18 TaxID=2654191 RepID=UPI0012D3A93E|nr:DUF3105 domain-containing protein [Cellulomonas sp. JZ18]QGQ19731.1 DUF3105 domain-containing protein [Cellulomonas sp. JZ18]
MSTRPRTRDERAATVARLRKEQARAERRRMLVVAGVAGTLVLGLVATATVVLVGEARRRSALEAQAAADIEGVESFDGLVFDHVEGSVDYAQNPPAGGAHNAVWQNCGVYDAPVVDEHAVHSLEHGAVWLTYDPDLPADQVALLEQHAADESYVLVSPYEGLPSPVVATAWGHQLQLPSADDERIDVFVRKYLLNPELPEAGALCSNGIGQPA